MKLTYFSVSNYRSITDAYKLDLQNVTVLIGKNNEGKSNLIKSLNLAMEVVRISRTFPRCFIPRQLYCWSDDFPVGLRSNTKIKNKSVKFRLDFKLDEEEIAAFWESVGSNINGDLSVYIEIRQDGSFSITVPKRGKNATALSSKIAKIAQFICDNIALQYIPAIRSESDAYEVISDIIESEFRHTDDEEYKKAQEYIEEYQRKKLEELSARIKEPLAVFMPSIKAVSLRLEERFSRRSFLRNKSFEININDGVLTSLSQKGDGVKSLTTMAILSKTNAKNRIIIIDEPEAHLHPEAIHYLKKVLLELGNTNQLIVSTHNPIFVNRTSVSSNIIVENHKATPAERIETIRKTLGVKIADNLVYSDYMIVVEGPSDKIVIERFMQEDEQLRGMLIDNTIVVKSIGGVRNLRNELYNLEQFLCNYLVILDFDDAGKNKAREVQQDLKVLNEKFRYFNLPNYRECELEELYNPELYKQYLMGTWQVDIANSSFKNKSKKWSKRVEELAALSGQILNEEQINDIKKDLSNMCAGKSIEECFTAEAITLLTGICSKIKSDVSQLFNQS